MSEEKIPVTLSLTQTELVDLLVAFNAVRVPTGMRPITSEVFGQLLAAAIEHAGVDFNFGDDGGVTVRVGGRTIHIGNYETGTAALNAFNDALRAGGYTLEGRTLWPPGSRE